MGEKLVKIAFDVTEQSDTGFEIERLWAKSIGDDLYVIDNSPFQAYGVSVGDKVRAAEQQGELKFEAVVERGGHSTYRVRLPEGRDHEYFLQYWEDIRLLGCTYEGASGIHRLYSIDVPSVEVVPAVYRILEEREKQGIWEFEEAHYFRPEDDV